MLKLLGGFSAQQNSAADTQKTGMDAFSTTRQSPATEAAETPRPQFNPPQGEAQREQPPAHNVMADVIVRHEQLAARARRKE